MPNALGVNVGRNRSHAIYRALAALLLLTIAAPVLAFLFLVAAVAAILILAVDFVLGLVRDDHWRGGMLKEWALRLFAWPFDIIWWTFSGKTTDGSMAFPWLP